MDEFSLPALGTTWTMVVDGDVLSDAVKQELTAEIERFENTYSRFKSESLLSQLNATQTSRPLPISPELETMLQFAVKLSAASDGLFDANVARWESEYGYNQNLDFKNADEVQLSRKGSYTIVNHAVVKDGLVQLDLGAFGKGFLIDLLAELLQKKGYKHFLIDGGRDFWGSSKADGSAWKIALEHPTDRTLAVGVAALKNQGFAASNSFHRRVGEFHHLLNGQTGQPANELASVYVVAKTAMEADGLSTALFVSHPIIWQKLKTEFTFEYVAVTADLKTSHSDNFPGDIFLS